MHNQTERLRIKLLYEQSIMTQVMGLFNVIVFFFVMHPILDSILLTIWFVFGVLLFFARALIQKWFQIHFIKTDKIYEPDFWENIFCLGTFLSGAHWATAGTVLISYDMVGYQTFLAFILAGTTAGATIAYCSSRKAVVTFLLPSLLPFATVLTVYGNTLQKSMAFMLLSYTVLVSLLLLRVNKYVVTSITLAFEKDDLLKKLKVSQAETIHSQQMAAIGTMAGGVAHEINTPLATINLYMQEMLSKSEEKNLPRSEVEEISVKVISVVARIAKIISALLSFSRSNHKKDFEPVYLGKVISDTLDICQTHFKNNGMTITVHNVPRDAIVLAHSSQIGQSLLNLLTNSFEAVRHTPAGWAKIDVQVDGGIVILSVTDSGNGIPNDIHQKIMEPFFTTKEYGKGPGLGLSTASGIIRDHGGSLKLDPHSPQTRFVISLPRFQHSPESPTASY